MSNNQAPTRYTFESGRRAVSHLTVRQVNAKTVLTIVAFNAGASNAEISRLSGLAPQTVSAILVGLEKQGLIVRGEVLRGRRGQPATPIMLNPDGGLAVGVEIGWRHLRVIVLNLHVKVIRERYLEYDFPDATTIVDTISDLVTDLTADLSPDQKARLLDLGIATPSRIADNLDLIGAPPEQAQFWGALDLVTDLQRKTGLKVTYVNDGNAGCWAELIALPTPRPANLIYLLVSQYIAAGVIADGQLWEGPNRHAAELGSILVCVGENSGPMVAHKYASIWALRAQLTSLSPRLADGPTSRLVVETPAHEMENWLRLAARALAQVIFNANTVVEQPLVVVDTVLSDEISATLAEAVTIELEHLQARTLVTPRVISGQLGAMGPVIGAAELSLYRRYF